MHSSDLETQFVAAVQHENWDKALGLINQLLTDKPSVASLHYNKALVLRRLQQTTAAEETLKNTLVLDENHHHARFELASLWLENEDYEKAVAGFDHYLLAVPNDADALLNIGRGLMRLDRAEDALTYLRHAWRLSPKTLTLESLILAEREAGRLDTALELLAQLPKDDVQACAFRLKALTQGRRGKFKLAVDAN